ncbi:hypothetical protein BE21_22760 [Sorangium cellulosum]|uniref:Uncharacterized protein n=1 Tax=Sorangium cellulosum TaxID=56 RepID=A0A150TVA5_SORCE|nr:hypothetical protein BE21_22760 [Sorangium cellulosum]
MIAPVAISCTQLGSPRWTPPVRITVMSSAPITLPATLPSPPESGAPPMTTAAMTSSSRPTESVGSPTVSVENSITPATPARRLDRVYTAIFTRPVSMPHSRAAASLLPTANTWRPKRVKVRTAKTRSASAAVIHSPGAARSAESSASRPRGSASTFCSDASPLAAPRSALIVPSVTTKGIIRARPTSVPATTPARPAAAAAASAAGSAGTPARRSVARTTVVNATSEPVERSIPPVAMTRVMPRAQMPTTTVCRAIVSRFWLRRNVSGVSAAKSA